MRIVLVLAATALTSLIGTAQAQQQTFRAATEVVEVDVRVVDKAGHFVSGLTADDFALEEDGVAQKIVYVILIGADAAASAPSGPATAAAVSVPAAPPVPPQVWLFVFDTGHLSAGGL